MEYPKAMDLEPELADVRNATAELIAKCRGNPELDQRWTSIAITTLQQGFMALERAIVQPKGF